MTLPTSDITETDIFVFGVIMGTALGLSIALVISTIIG